MKELLYEPLFAFDEYLAITRKSLKDNKMVHLWYKFNLYAHNPWLVIIIKS